MSSYPGTVGESCIVYEKMGAWNRRSATRACQLLSAREQTRCRETNAKFVHLAAWACPARGCTHPASAKPQATRTRNGGHGTTTGSSEISSSTLFSSGQKQNSKSATATKEVADGTRKSFW